MQHAGRQVARLTVLLACVALAASRFGLVAHEYAGHGGAALALGGTVSHVKLFWFAGGWIGYDIPGATAGDLAIAAMGGIAFELVAAAVMVAIARRRDGLGWALVRALGAMFAVHALWYFATGVWHGYGDGELVSRELGDARYPLAIVAGAGAIAAAWRGAGAVVGRLRATVGGSLAALCVAAVIAGGANLALYFGELHVRTDRTYTAMMQHERERAIAVDYARWAKAQHGTVDAEARETARTRIAAEHPKDFPFAVLLAICLVAAAGIGGARSPRREEAEIARGLIVRAALAAVVGTAIVIAIAELS